MSVSDYFSLYYDEFIIFILSNQITDLRITNKSWTAHLIFHKRLKTADLGFIHVRQKVVM